MGIDYHAICRETKDSIRLGRLYEWGGGRRDTPEDHIPDPQSGESQVDVGYGYMWRLVYFMYDRQGKLVEIVQDEVLWDLRREFPEWKELEDQWLEQKILE